ncbi:MAG: S8 family serine peptidase [Cyanobacteria bacterium P01_F01_bin.86]
MSDRFPVLVTPIISDSIDPSNALQSGENLVGNDLNSGEDLGSDTRMVALPFTSTDASLDAKHSTLEATEPAQADEVLSFQKSTDGLAKIMGQALAELHSQANLDSDLLDQTPGSNSLLIATDDYVVVDFTASGSSQDLVVDLERLGAEDITVFGRVVSAKLPPEKLEDAAQLSSLLFARPAYAPISSAGSVTGQGDVALNADEARSNFRVDGSGITVGILSDSFNNLGGEAADVASGDLPSGVLVLDELDTGNGEDEGRAMAQLVHDVAPGADLQFHTAFEGQASFAQGIVDLANAGSDIIVDDIFYHTEPMFQDGIIAQAVDQVVADGVSYFSAAGNTGAQSYESAFRGVNDPTLESSYLWHDFDPTDGVDTRQNFTLANNESILLSFQWDEPFASAGGAGSRSDLDIFILDENEQTVASGDDYNIGADAVEVVSFTNTTGSTATFDILIGQYLPEGEITPTLIKYIDFEGGTDDAEYFTDSATAYGHVNASGALAVGAAYYEDTPEFGQADPIAESFTALGGIPILFDPAGNRLDTPEKRDTVDFVAPDGSNNTFFGSTDFDDDGLPNFFGTSASAPQAAATAALMLELDPELTPAEIEQALEATAIDMATPGFDPLTGAGLIQTDTALAAVAPGVTFAEYGNLELTQEWQTITLNNDYVNPVVIVSDPTFNDDDPVGVRLQDITSDTFQIRLQEPQYLDDVHAPESASYLVIEAGDWILEDGTRIAAGTYESDLLSTEGFESVDLTGFDSKPVILSQVQTFNGHQWVVTRLRGQSPRGFSGAMQEEEALNSGSHTSETIGWLAIDQKTATSDDTLLQGGRTARNYTHEADTVSFDPKFEETPSLIAKIGSYRGKDTANLRLEDITNTGFGVRIHEEQSKDLEIKHNKEETVSFLALEGQSGILTGFEV